MDDLGDRMKGYERVETERRLDPARPVYARIDGRGFSTFTRGMAKPFDERLSRLMIDVTRDLVEATAAVVGYTQSDEISLGWHLDLETNPLSDLFFGGRTMKLASVIASMTASHFMRRLVDTEVDFARFADKAPHFDCRVYNLPDREELANAFLWRELDAGRNAVAMVAQAHYPQSRLNGVDVQGQLDLIAAKSVDFGALPDFFRRGTFVRRREVEVDRIVPKGVAKPRVAAGPLVRRRIEVSSLPPFRRLSNRPEVIFGADPVIAA